jgi:hypothetical protein
MRVYGEDVSAMPPMGGMRPGEEVSFRINGFAADVPAETAIWQNDKTAHELSLAFTWRGSFLPLVVR